MQSTLYSLVQQCAAEFIAHTEASTGAALPEFVKDEFDTFLECGILAHGFLRLRCGECSHDKLLASAASAGELKIIAAILERVVIEKSLDPPGSGSTAAPGRSARAGCTEFGSGGAGLQAPALAVNRQEVVS